MFGIAVLINQKLLLSSKNKWGDIKLSSHFVIISLFISIKDINIRIMRKKYSLAENRLRGIIREAVKNILMENDEQWWGVWSVDSWAHHMDPFAGEIKYIFLLVKAETKEEAEGIAEERLMRRNWMTDPVANAHPATREDFDRWKRQDLIDYE